MVILLVGVGETLKVVFILVNLVRFYVDSRKLVNFSEIFSIHTLGLLELK